MQLTMEKVTLIAVSLATVAGVMAILMNILSPSVELASVNSVSNVFSTIDYGSKRWFNILLVVEGEINSITPLDTNCRVDVYEIRVDSVILYGYCDGTPTTLSLSIDTSEGELTVAIPLSPR